MTSKIQKHRKSHIITFYRRHHDDPTLPIYFRSELFVVAKDMRTTKLPHMVNNNMAFFIHQPTRLLPVLLVHPKNWRKPSTTTDTEHVPSSVFIMVASISFQRCFGGDRYRTLRAGFEFSAVPSIRTPTATRLTPYLEIIVAIILRSSFGQKKQQSCSTSMLTKTRVGKPKRIQQRKRSDCWISSPPQSTFLQR
mmetsp:Transcript_7104/g.15672  ORF Transcript_7104/g.15672 Transcript_7104/m.15672 type:complete len:194 (-) Transcript_7104:756-1337(-)